jgi:hypothetical protein
MLISILTIEMIILNYFYDEEMLVNDYYEIFLNEHGDSVPEIYQCSKQNVINKKQYQIKNRYSVKNTLKGHTKVHQSNTKVDIHF